MEPANQDAAPDPRTVPIDLESGGGDPPAVNTLKVFIDPVGQTVAPGPITVSGRTEGGNPLVRIIEGLLSRDGGGTWGYFWGRELGENRFEIFIPKTNPNTNYLFKVHMTDNRSVESFSEPISFSTGS